MPLACLQIQEWILADSQISKLSIPNDTFVAILGPTNEKIKL